MAEQFIEGMQRYLREVAGQASLRSEAIGDWTQATTTGINFGQEQQVKREARETVEMLGRIRDAAGLIRDIVGGRMILPNGEQFTISTGGTEVETRLASEGSTADLLQAEKWREWHEPEGEKPALIGSGEFPGANRFYQYPHERFGDLRLPDHDVRG